MLSVVGDNLVFGRSLFGRDILGYSQVSMEIMHQSLELKTLVLIKRLQVFFLITHRMETETISTYLRMALNLRLLHWHQMPILGRL